MQPLKAYTVIKGSTDRTLREGDIVWLSENEDLNISGGWLSKDEWNRPETNDFIIEECATHCVLKNGKREILMKKELLKNVQ